jgi:hypothetical protein
MSSRALLIAIGSSSASEIVPDPLTCLDMWGLFRRRHKAPVGPLLVVVGNRFAPGAQISGHAVLGPELGDARVELRHVDLVRGTKVYDQPLTFRQLRAGLKHAEQTFVLDIPDRIPARNETPYEYPVEDSGWEVCLVIDRVQRASRRIHIE